MPLILCTLARATRFCSRWRRSSSRAASCALDADVEVAASVTLHDADVARVDDHARSLVRPRCRCRGSCVGHSARRSRRAGRRPCPRVVARVGGRGVATYCARRSGSGGQLSHSGTRLRRPRRGTQNEGQSACPPKAQGTSKGSKRALPLPMQEFPRHKRFSVV